MWRGPSRPSRWSTNSFFPTRAAHFSRFLKQSTADPGRLRADLATAGRGESRRAGAGTPRLSIHKRGRRAAPARSAYLNWLMDRDRKSTALKSLQGRSGRQASSRGELKGTLFADVPAALCRWAARAQVAIYSSGSVEAQQLLFRYSDLWRSDPADRRLLRHTHRPEAGQCASYAAIAAAMNVEPNEVLFFSDVVRELNAGARGWPADTAGGARWECSG